MTGGLGEWSHWLLMLLVVGTLLLIFMRNPDKTKALFKTGTGTYQDLANTGQSFATSSALN